MSTSPAPPQAPRRRKRSIVVVVVVVVLGLALVASRSGLLRPHVTAGPSSQAGVTPQGQVLLSFPLTNNGLTAATLRSVAAGAPGLADPRVLVSSGTSQPSLLPVRIAHHSTVTVEITYPHLDCAEIGPGSAKRIPLRISGPAGIAFTFHAEPEAALDSATTGSPPLGSGWAYRLAVTACHGGRA